MARPQSEVRTRGAGMSRIGRRRSLRTFSAFITRWMELNIATYSPSRTMPTPHRPHSVTAAAAFQAIPRLTTGRQTNKMLAMHTLIILIGLILIAVIVNIPLGYLRQGYEKFTFGWYFYVHISIPLIIYLRIKSGYSWKFIPLTLGGAIIGQVVGGRIHKKRNT